MAVNLQLAALKSQAACGQLLTLPVYNNYGLTVCRARKRMGTVRSRQAEECLPASEVFADHWSFFQSIQSP